MGWRCGQIIIYSVPALQLARWVIPLPSLRPATEGTKGLRYMTGIKLSQRLARRRGELHHADGDRRVAQAIEAHRHQNTPDPGRASIQPRERRRRHDGNNSVAL